MIIYLGEPPEQLVTQADREVTTTLPETGDQPPTCIVVDLSVNSLHIVEELADTRPDTPIIALLDEETSPEDALSRNVSDYFYKSKLPDQTELFVRRVLAYSTQRAGKPEESEQLTAYDDIERFEVNESGEITAVSAGFAELLGATPEELTGEQLSDRLVPAAKDRQPPETDDALESIRNLQPGRRSEILVETPDGETKRLQLSAISKTETGGVLAIVHDVTAYHDRIKELELYEKITEAVPDPLYYVDKNGIIQAVNPAMTEVYEFDSEEMVGSYFGIATAEEGETKLYDAVRTMLSDKNDIETRMVEYQALSGTGETFPVAHHITVLESGGEFSGTVGLIRDITERTERQQRLQVINRLLRHNVRNQFTLIIGEASTLARDVSPEQAEAVQTILDQSWKTVEMIEKMKKAGDLLDERPHNSRVLIAEPIEAAVDRFDGVDAEIGVSVPEELSVYAIPGLTFAVENLVENAIEHNPATDPVVEITVTSDDEWVTVEVADNGEPIPEFEQAVIEAGSEDPLDHGSGIGLWIVNWIVQRSRGDMEFGQSDLGGASVKLLLQKSQ
jgi:PAS domain S-box-containing protein